MTESIVTIYKSTVGNIYEIRGKKVMIDSDLAALYGVATKALNQSVTRNTDRFPADFIFTLTQKELSDLRSQIVTSSWGGRRYSTTAFTEHGILMLSSILRSAKAVQVNIQIMRSFIALREALATNAQLNEKLNLLEAKYDQQFKVVFATIRRMLEQDIEESGEKLGFRLD